MTFKSGWEQALLRAVCAIVILVSFGASAASSPTITYPQAFSTGWNLVGNSLTTPINVSATFSTQTDIDSVWKWDAVGAKWEFYSPSLDSAGTLAAYAATNGFGVLTEIKPAEGYWVRATSPVSLGAVSGTAVSLTAANLVPSWNLAATGDEVTPAIFTSTVRNVISQWAWDTTTSAWYFYSPALAANNSLASYITSQNYKDFQLLPSLGNGIGFWVNYAGPSPDAPTGLLATAVSSSQVNLTWMAVSGATGYKVYRSNATGTVLSPGNLVSTTGSTTASITNHLASTTYYYVVTAMNNAAESFSSSEVSATTFASPPAAPAGATATSAGTTKVNLGWTVTSGATSYNVYRSTSPSVQLIATNMITTAGQLVSATYSDTGLTAGTSYYYKVTASNAAGESLASTEVSATTASLAQVGGSLQGRPLNLTGVVTTFAGTGGAGALNNTGSAASFNYPYAIATDGTNLFVADTGNHKVRKIVIATGAVSTLAGSGTPGAADGTGAAASFSGPLGITTDGTYLFVADTNNSVIRKIEISTGVVTTVAGTGVAGAVDGIGTAASFNNPRGITTDGTNLYVVDTSNNKIRQIEIATRVVTTLAGSGSDGVGVSGGPDGIGVAATFRAPTGIATDGINLYVGDTADHKIRKIVIATTAVTTLAGRGTAGALDGTGTAAGFDRPAGLTTDGTNVYVADSTGHVIRKIVIGTAVVTTVAGTGGSAGARDATGTVASFNYPHGITSDGTHLYVADTFNHKIRKIQGLPTVAPTAPVGVAAIAAGSSQVEIVWSGIPDTTAYSVYRSTSPNVQLIPENKIAAAVPVATTWHVDSGLTPATSYYYRVTASNGVGEGIASAEVVATTTAGGIASGPQMGGAVQGVSLDLSGAVTTYAGSGANTALDGTGTSASFNYPQGMATDGTNIYVADSGKNKIRKIVIATGVVSTLAGSGVAGALDGVGLAATFNYPNDVTTDGVNLYVADSSNNRIRKIVIATGVVSTLAGSGGTGSVNGLGTAAQIAYPTGITTDGINLYVVSGRQVRKITIGSGLVSTLAGTGAQGAVDGPGTAASFSYGSGITTDGLNLYVADSSNYKIRKVVIATGTVSTLAGSGVSGATDGTGALAKFSFPTGITTDGTNVYVTDSSINKIRKVVIATGVVTTLAGSGVSGALDGTGSAATFNGPAGITTNGVSLYVADSGNNKIRKLLAVSETPTAPPAPTSVTASASSTSQISINWTNVAGATSYNVYRSTSPGVQLTVGNRITTAAQTTAGPFQHTSLSPSTAYYYKVTAVNAIGESVASSEVSAVTAAAPIPTAPTNLAVTSSTSNLISLAWTNVSGATSYNIYRSTSPNVQIISANNIASPSTGSYPNSGLTASTTYYYKVTAVNASGESAPSGEITGTTFAGPLSGSLLLVTGNTARNGSYAPDAAKRATGADILVLGHTTDGKFEYEITYTATGSITTATIWFFGSNNVITFFGCNATTVPCGSSLSYEPLTKKLVFNNLLLAQVAEPFSNPVLTVVQGGESITVNGQITTEASAGAGIGVTFSPSFAGVSTIANAVPTTEIVAAGLGGGTKQTYAGGLTFLYRLNSGIEEFNLTFIGSALSALNNGGFSFAPGSCAVASNALGAPLCSSFGITFNKTAGTVSFVNTPMGTGLSGNAPTVFVMNGSLTFPPF